MQRKGDHIRIPPQSVEAEQALLGSVCLRPEAIHEVTDIVREEDFYSDKHRVIWRAMMELMGKGEPIDLLSLSSRLKDKGELDRVGGASYLSELVQLVPSASNVRHYASIVQKKSMMRRLIEAGEHITSLSFEERGELEEIIDDAEKSLFSVTNSIGTHKFIELKDTLGEAWERLDKLHNSKDELRGVPTGFKGLDNKLSGFQKSDLIILAARPSMGKTSLALDIARKAAVEHNIPVGIFSLEMSSQQLVDRMLAAEARVDAWKLRTGRNLSIEHDFGRIRDAMDKLAKAPIFIDDQPGNNILKMRAIARRLKAEKNLGLIIVDYLQLMTPVQSINSDNVVQQVTEISRGLKNLARDLDVPVIALSQLNRAVESRGGKPRLSDLRDSGSIEQDADVVMFIHREKDESGEQARSREATILIEKHRNGPTGEVQLVFDSDKSTFLPVEKADFGEFVPAQDGSF
ncbi:MAG: replicative DNA helicase [Patescibacteria group bacterium]|nr:replicative DNA helicase [Patescibacteria group bacterium]MDE2116469.1 replicative DNA helicase [Patescibacteria group bacterium]